MNKELEELQKPLTAIEQAELISACKTHHGDNQQTILTPTGIMLLRRALFELNILREKQEANKMSKH